MSTLREGLPTCDSFLLCRLSMMRALRDFGPKRPGRLFPSNKFKKWLGIGTSHYSRVARRGKERRLSSPGVATLVVVADEVDEVDEVHEVHEVAGESQDNSLELKLQLMVRQTRVQLRLHRLPRRLLQLQRQHLRPFLHPHKM